MEAFDQLPWGICILDRALVVRGWNSTLSEWTGISQAEALGMDLLESFPRLRDASSRKRIERVFETGCPTTFPAELPGCFIPATSPDSNPKEEMVQRTLVRPMAADKDQVLVLIEDVTTQYRQMEQLSTERNRLQTVMAEIESKTEQLNAVNAIVEATQDAIIGVGLDGAIRSWNPGANKVFQYALEEILGSHIATLSPRGHQSEITELFGPLKDGEKLAPFDTSLQRKDGSHVDVALSLSPILNVAGRVDGLAVIARDISVRKEAENRLNYLSAIVASSEDAIVCKTLEGVITSWNDSAEQLYGYSAEEILGKHHSVLVPPDVPNEVSDFLERARRGERTDSFDTVRQHKDGDLVEVSLNVSPIRNTQGEIVGASAISRDISERKKTETALQQSIQEVVESHEELSQLTIQLEFINKKLAESKSLAEQANQSKGEFLANMTHEIRTPMTAILGFTDVLLGEVDAQEKPTEHVAALQTIKRNGEHLLNLLNDVLDLSKIDSGRLEVESIACDPIQIIEDVATLMQVRADAKRLPLEVQYVGPIPQTVETDPTRLRQILINLLGNAIKFTESGYVRLVTRLLQATDELPPRLRFDIVDSGIGMTEEQLAKLFRPFTQADASTTRKFGGTGLGLTISKRLAEMLDGTIDVRSKPGLGTTFTVTLAVGVPGNANLITRSTDASNRVQRAIKRTEQESSQLNYRVLLAEDGPDNQRLISFVLAKAGLEVEIAENGQLAVELALAARDRGQPYDVILMDMQMPVLDGYNATRKLREVGYELPIIALTANAMSGDREKCLQAGCDEYTTKPIDRKALLSLIASCGSRAARKEPAGLSM